jgi:hypothetical protein
MVDTVGVLVGPMNRIHVNAGTITRSDGMRATNSDVAMVTGEVERGAAWFGLSHRGSSHTADTTIPIGGALSRLDRMTGDQVRVVGSDGGLSLSLGRGDIEWLDVWDENGESRRIFTVENDGTGSGAPMAVVRMVHAWHDSMQRGALSEWDAGFDVGCAVQEVLSGVARS